ncbi:ribbon-helix-helix protein, CopG family [Govanella unica]|uniref:Ribbon-helix-helix protein, CopG family n=1 Tax=Govanella unica TaxID=2975056 RepID=A0A9X3Z7S5_9PROT|nr:ribbon-helix-helix protein, CopG family [Govania unica]MDA5194461.1 ribbon-helix-helix protein, CopG family [Govania unica]
MLLLDAVAVSQDVVRQVSELVARMSCSTRAWAIRAALSAENTCKTRASMMMPAVDEFSATVTTELTILDKNTLDIIRSQKPPILWSDSGQPLAMFGHLSDIKASIA